MVDDGTPTKLNSAIRDSETVHWTGSTHKLAKLTDASVVTLFFFGILVMFHNIFIGGEVAVGRVVALFFLMTAIQFFTGKSKHVVTDERVLSYSSSILDGDVEYIEWSDITTIDVKEGITDKLFGTESLKVGGYRADEISFKHISDAYETLNTIEKVR